MNFKPKAWPEWWFGALEKGRRAGNGAGFPWVRNLHPGTVQSPPGAAFLPFQTGNPGALQEQRCTTASGREVSLWQDMHEHISCTESEIKGKEKKGINEAKW